MTLYQHISIVKSNHVKYVMTDQVPVSSANRVIGRQVNIPLHNDYGDYVDRSSTLRLVDVFSYNLYARINVNILMLYDSFGLDI